MKYLKLFNNHSQYTAFTQTEDFILPNVSKCISENDIHYNPLPDPFNGIAYVDMGFPSGTKWATVNIGATEPLEQGNYYTWGETTGYNPEEDTIPEYDPETAYSKYTPTDGKTTLELTEDAARVNMGGEWVTPSVKEWMELSYNTVAEPVIVNEGAKGEDSTPLGIKYTSIYNGNYIIIPANNLVEADLATKKGSNTDTKGVDQILPFSYLWTNERDSSPEETPTRGILQPYTTAKAAVLYCLSGTTSLILSMDPVDNTPFIREGIYMPVRGVVREEGAKSIVLAMITFGDENLGAVSTLIDTFHPVITNDWSGIVTSVGFSDSYVTNQLSITILGTPEDAQDYTISLYRENEDVICSNVDVHSNTYFMQSVQGQDLSNIVIVSPQTYLPNEVLSGYIEKNGIRTNMKILIYGE